MTPTRGQRELDFVAFQIAELEAAAIRSALELDETLEELTRLTELRDGQAALVATLDELDADGDGAVLARFARAINQLPRGEAYDGARASLRACARTGARGGPRTGGVDRPGVLRRVGAEGARGPRDRSASHRRKYGSLAVAMTSLEELCARRRASLEQASSRTAALDDQIDTLHARVIALSETARAGARAAAELTERGRGAPVAPRRAWRTPSCASWWRARTAPTRRFSSRRIRDSPRVHCRRWRAGGS